MGLTPPSSGRAKGRFAPLAPPLMSNVSPHNLRADMPRLLKSLAVSSVLILFACASSPPALLPPEAVASQRLAQYAELLQRQDSSAIAGMFEPAGSMAHQGQSPILGRAAIQAFLESFASYKVLSHKMQVTSAVAQGHTVQQTGTYAQSVLAPDGRTLQVGGTFTVIWQQEQDGQWLIQSLRTAPAGEG